MRLSRIKIAGFKSFVDPTELKLPSSLVGVVGPNGCGKSNIIDAVRWVMGESSAKHLRGESMDDVIFAGSGTRKPVGQASVELIFDNTDGSLGGEYAGFGEISVRREVSRDGQSKYALNGVRCRRRDVRDIFLGTGLGPRSYSIIEQGMISRLIEAKPEEMRVYLEEAAGISKYKERRRETETRIRHTRENLDRLNDLREEVDKQLARLERQAKMAEKFQVLKTQERQKRGELLVLRRRAYEADRDERASKTGSLETELEAQVAKLRSAERAIEQARKQQSDSSDHFSQIQAEFYRLGSEVSRIEQTIEHKKESRERQSQELAEVNRLLAESKAHRDDDIARIAQIDESMQSDQPAFDGLQDTQRLSAEHLQRAEKELQQWQIRHDEFNLRLSQTTQICQVEASRIEQMDRNIGDANIRLTRLREEFDSLDTEGLKQNVERFRGEERDSSEYELRLNSALTVISDKQQSQKASIAQHSEALDQMRARIQSRVGRLASLEALQQAALESESGAAESWLQANQLTKAPRLAQSIAAEPGWEAAIELVLGPFLEAVCVDAEQLIQRCLDEAPEAQLTLVHTQPDNIVPAAQSLASKVSGEAPLTQILAGVYAADNLAEALRIKQQLEPGQSVVTKDGLWFGQSWLRLERAAAKDSVLLRENEIADLRIEIDSLQQSIVDIEAELAEYQQRQDELDTQRETQLHAVNDAVRAHSIASAALASEEHKLEQSARRREDLKQQIQELATSIEQDQQQLSEATMRRTSALESLDVLESEKSQIDEESETLRSNLDSARKQQDADRDAGQALAVRVESLRSTRAATEQNLDRLQTRMTQLQQRQAALDAELTGDEDLTLATLDQQLQAQLEAKLGGDQALRTAREQLSEIEQRLRAHEQERQQHDGRVQSLREQVQGEKMAAQEVLVRLKTIDEQMLEQHYELDTISAQLPAEAEVDTWASELSQIEQRLERLGPINLAAIDELAEQETRKQYLDEQHLDVTEALETLERAISKIDRETRSRFKETFDDVNTKVQQYFPRLFGGGHGSLEMTGDDLLSAGVLVNAQPPGKRVSSIQLLSGGEKALAAVALVFAFFELNPSPFCMLDEVDAPLDDANVGRFCQLVMEMSERVQFIFITHNKVTMEMSRQLMGVTMNEPGVSRLVAVDVQEAVELASV